jgi:hypothetical protein
MARKTIAFLTLAQGGASAVAAYPLAHSWPPALATGALAALLTRIVLAYAPRPCPAPASRRA